MDQDCGRKYVQGAKDWNDDWVRTGFNYIMKTDNIYEKIKRAGSQRFITNCYTREVVEKSVKLWEMGDEFIFSYDDHGVNRLVYFASSWKTIDKLLELVNGGIYYLEFLIRDSNEYVPENARPVARMMRLANPDCRTVFEENSEILQYRDADMGDKAGVEDAAEIHEILWSAFHTEISHLLTVEELKKIIEAGGMTVHRNNSGRIDAILQADILPKKFYINQVVNMGEKNIIHAMLLNRLDEYVAYGGRYLYAWVEDKNVASQKFHRKYGMKHDGMFSMIYCVEK